MRVLEFLTGHVIFKLRYNQIYQMKTTHMAKMWTYILEIWLRHPLLYLLCAVNHEVERGVKIAFKIYVPLTITACL